MERQRSTPPPDNPKASRQPTAGSVAPVARPVGRAVVSDALVAAAERLFATRGPDAVSLRDIAAEADVNFGLLYKYIGTRDEILRLVFDRVSERASTSLAEAPDFAAAVRVMRTNNADNVYARMMAWSILEGHALHERETHLRPATVSLLDHARAALSERGLPDERQARAVLALVYSFHLGWRLFSEHFLPAFELSQWEGVLDAAVSDVIAGLPEQLTLEFPPAKPTPRRPSKQK